MSGMAASRQIHSALQTPDAALPDLQHTIPELKSAGVTKQPEIMHGPSTMQRHKQPGARCIALKYELSNLSHSMVQEVPPGVPGPFSVYLVFSLPKPDLSFLTRPSV